MAVTFHHFVSVYSFIMGVLWFNIFVILGLIMRKLKSPIKISVVPLLLLLVLSVLRMFVVIEIPGTVIILSETIYPAIVSILRFEIMRINAISVLVIIWIAGTVWRIAKYIYIDIGKLPSLITWFGSYPRDKYAEAMLADIIGKDKKFRVYRNGCFNVAGATPFRPYIILPEIEFTDEELRIILLHEWKHIRDKDYLTRIIVNLISFLFWWNPLVYVLKKNFEFAKELKCDQFAVSNENDFYHFLDGIQLLGKPDKQLNHGAVNTFVTDGDNMADRLEVLALRNEEPRCKRVLTNACYSIVMVAMFFVSYTFTILPAFWESPDVPVSAETFTEEYSEGGGVFRPEDIFIVDNKDGTFSLYIDGQFAVNIDATNEMINLLPIVSYEYLNQ